MRRTIRPFSILILAVLLLAWGTVAGQKKKEPAGWWQRDWQVNLSGGTTLALGDMKFAWDGNADVQPGYSIWFGKQLTPSFGIRFQAVNSRLSGTGSLYSPISDTTLPAEFQAKIFEYNLSAFYYFFKPYSSDNIPRNWNLYVTAGAGYAHFVSDNYSLVDGSYITGNGHNYGKGINGRTLEAVFPVGLGADISVIPNLKFNIETNLHTVTSDILDNKTGGFGYDQYLYTSAGLTYRFDANIKLWEPKKLELARYQSDPDLLPLRYTRFYSTTGGVVASSLKALQPAMAVTIPKNIYSEPEVNITIDFKNAGREGVLDLDFVFQPEFQMEVPDAKKYLITPNSQGANIQFKVPATDTNQVSTFRLLTASVPNGSFPFFMTGKFVAYSGEVFQFKEMEYIEKDARIAKDRSDSDSLDGFLSGIKFRVQIMSSKGTPVPAEKIKSLFPDEKNIREEHENGWYYYMAGLFKTREDADAYKDKLEIETGLKGMFSVMYQNDKRSHNMQDVYAGYRPELGGFDALRKNGKRLANDNPEEENVDEYRVRFLTAYEFRASLSEIETRMGTEEVITEVTEGENYYYFAGSFRKKAVALAYADYLREKIGFTEATVVAFSKGNPVNMK